MKVVLATGIYPPDIGGPATYVEGLADAFSKLDNEVTIITYGSHSYDNGRLVVVSRNGNPFTRWLRYAKALRKHAVNADVVVAFSSVSVGVPLMWAGLRRPKKILRLGGDFFWERYTDKGGMMGLADWHASPRSWIWRCIMQMILKRFDHVTYSSQFQYDIHRRFYRLPQVSVIQNPLPPSVQVEHQPHQPFRLLFMGRFVGFKNLLSLVAAVATLPDCCLTLVGDGPMRCALECLGKELRLGDRLSIAAPVRGSEKDGCFDGHDLFVIPSLTEISPNVAAEASARGLPILITEETGFRELEPGRAVTRSILRTPEDIAAAVRRVMQKYPTAASDVPDRDWQTVAAEWIQLFRLRS